MSQTGEVIRLVEQKGFGFIQGEDKKDYFFHKDDFNGFWADLIGDFTQGISIRVTFSGRESPKGLRADDVKRIDFPN